MYTVTQLARKCGVSRATVLYYERVGLLAPARRAENGYRWYGDSEVTRLESILSYRSYGVPVQRIGGMLECGEDVTQRDLLRQHFDQLEREIARLRAQQKAIVGLLQEPDLLADQGVTKDRWVAIMKAAGLDETAMRAWHQRFEEMEPEQHQKFLESLGIDQQEIESIRNLQP
jgi:DNA-binding transcriptional MerR regulator